MKATMIAAASVPERQPSLAERLRALEAALREHAADANGMGGLAADDVDEEGGRLSTDIVDVADEMAVIALELGGPPAAVPGPMRSGLPRLAAWARGAGRRPMPPWQRGRR